MAPVNVTATVISHLPTGESSVSLICTPDTKSSSEGLSAQRRGEDQIGRGAEIRDVVDPAHLGLGRHVGLEEVVGGIAPATAHRGA